MCQDESAVEAEFDALFGQDAEAAADQQAVQKAPAPPVNAVDFPAVPTSTTLDDLLAETEPTQAGMRLVRCPHANSPFHRDEGARGRDGRRIVAISVLCCLSFGLIFSRPSTTHMVLGRRFRVLLRNEPRSTAILNRNAHSVLLVNADGSIVKITEGLVGTHRMLSLTRCRGVQHNGLPLPQVE
jgi:hypothetical protein